jgi:hypothetical protein
MHKIRDWNTWPDSFLALDIRLALRINIDQIVSNETSEVPTDCTIIDLIQFLPLNWREIWCFLLVVMLWYRDHEFLPFRPRQLFFIYLCNVGNHSHNAAMKRKLGRTFFTTKRLSSFTSVAGYPNCSSRSSESLWVVPCIYKCLPHHLHTCSLCSKTVIHMKTLNSFDQKIFSNLRD